MIRKGQVSTIDLANKKVTVTFKDLGDSVTAKLPLMTIPIKDSPVEIRIGVTESGTISIKDIPDYKVNDWVVVAFFGCNFSDGVVLGKIGGD